MSNGRSREALFEFLEYLGAKGLMASGTVQARRASAGKILGILGPEEAADVTNLDVDQIMSRFHNLEGRNYTPGSLATYRSRLTSTLEDFRSYLANPIAYRPNTQRQKPAKPSENIKRDSDRSQDRPAEASLRPVAPPPSAGVIPIPIRADLIVQIHGIPFDLTRAEAQRVANVILALSND